MRTTLVALLALASAGCQSYTARLDVMYSPGQSLTEQQVIGVCAPGGPPQVLDLYTPTDGEGPWPTILHIHGGAWRSGSKADDGEEVARRLCPEGFAVASVDYHLAPPPVDGRFPIGGQWPAQLTDVLEAIGYLRREAAFLHLDPARIGTFGVSAGGHLAAMAALSDPGVRCAVVSAGEGDLRVFGREPIMADEVAILSWLFGRPPPWTEDLLADASPCAHVRRDVSILVLHSEHDTNVYATQGRRLHAALVEAGATTDLVVTPDGGHGRAWRQDAQLRPLIAWFHAHLR